MAEKVHVVLLPGLDGTGMLFKPFIEQFPSDESFTVVSYPTDRFIPYSELLAFILSVIPNDKPIVILGESYSGPAAIQLASQSDLDIRGIILVATFARFPDSFLKLISRFIPLSLMIRLPLPVFLIRHFCFGQFGGPELVKILRQSIKDNIPSVFSRRARDGATIDVISEVKALTVPCLYIQASNDRLVPKTAAVELQACNKHVKVIEIDGPHFILQAQPKQCYELINQEFHVG